MIVTLDGETKLLREEHLTSEVDTSSPPCPNRLLWSVDGSWTGCYPLALSSSSQDTFLLWHPFCFSDGNHCSVNLMTLPTSPLCPKKENPGICCESRSLSSVGGKSWGKPLSFLPGQLTVAAYSQRFINHLGQSRPQSRSESISFLLNKLETQEPIRVLWNDFLEVTCTI